MCEAWTSSAAVSAVDDKGMQHSSCMRLLQPCQPHAGSMHKASGVIDSTHLSECNANDTTLHTYGHKNIRQCCCWCGREAFEEVHIGHAHLITKDFRFFGAASPREHLQQATEWMAGRGPACRSL